MKLLMKMMTAWLLSISCFAAGAKHELGLGTSGAALAISGGTATFAVMGDYHYLVASGFQVGTQSSFAVGGGDTAFTILVGPTLNFPFEDELVDSFFLSGYVGVSNNTLDTGLAFGFNLGKRFALTDSIAYAPSVILSKVDGYEFLFKIVFASFRFVF